MPLKDLAMSPEEAKETMMGYCESDVKDAPKYPWGTELDLNDTTLKKLGLTSLPAVGSEVTITAVAKVTRISAREEQGGAEQCLGLQITQMDLNSQGGEQPAANKLYGAKPAGEQSGSMLADA